jgi:hypothetical protein
MRFTVFALAILAIATDPRDASAYSVLAHEANVDALWEPAIRPLLQRRFPAATRDQLVAARAYAYGGSVIQDLGYYPFGSHFFSNLLHYVRTGDMVETMIRGAHDVNEYAFALGALAHYTADNVGHPEAVNKSVALMFPKLRKKYGDSVTYVDSPASHVMMEFSFDVVQTAAGAYLPEAYHSFIGFEVSKPLLERAFRETYGLEMKEVFGDEDRAISTFRHAISELLPELTRAAWRDKRKEIERLTPGVQESVFVYRLVPKIGPLKPLRFRTPTAEAEALFSQSLRDTRARYGAALEAVGRGRIDFTNTNFDTGRPTVHGEYELADETYADLVHRLADAKGATIPPALRADLNRYYDASHVPSGMNVSRKAQKRADKIRKLLAQLNADGKT